MTEEDVTLTRRQERFLGDVFGIGGVAGDEPGRAKGKRLISANDLIERRQIALAGRSNQLSVGPIVQRALLATRR